MPGLNRLRYTALVLACPIAYRAEDGTLWLTDSRGTHNLKIFDGPASAPTWSPSGEEIAFSCSDANGSYTGILNLMTKEIRKFPVLERNDYYSSFLGWVDRMHFIQGYCRGRVISVCSALTGSVVREVSYDDVGIGWNIEFSPDQFVGGYFTNERKTNWTPCTDIKIRNRDFKVVRTIWEDSWYKLIEDDHPRINPSREWVAWSRGKQVGDSPPRLIAMKRLFASPSKYPKEIAGQFANVFFCDWTPDGLLVNIQFKKSEPWQLAILDKEGNLVRAIPTPTPPMSKSYAASYRHRM